MFKPSTCPENRNRYTGRWAAAAFLDAGKGYRRIMGYKNLWILKAHLDELGTPPVDAKEIAA